METRGARATRLHPRGQPGHAGLTIADLRKATGRSKHQLEGFLVWLEDCRAVTRVDDDHYRRWFATADEDDKIAMSPSMSAEELDRLRELAGLQS